ncbi:hypothetical protein K5L52_000597 [Listeria monocytogenes]|nr:hypothetical protein [Listeria monocytogenes]HBM3885549.1 hypothetical protein [Listeria innocua]EAE9317033.1 hypothetical protein [Listeria monocytogenes]EAF3612576.1 hypothetical protein [Listeria monocytogenes]EGA9021913.1 hypothetical protein [Listeria monocytogenes]
MSKNLYAIKQNGLYKHFPQCNYNKSLSKDCLFVRKDTAEKNCASDGSDEIVEIILVEMEGEA